MMISGFDYLLQLQLKGCTGEVALPPLVGSKQAIQPQPSNPAEIVGGAMWHAGFVANWHSNMFDNDHLSDQRMIPFANKALIQSNSSHGLGKNFGPHIIVYV